MEVEPKRHLRNLFATQHFNSFKFLTNPVHLNKYFFSSTKNNKRKGFSLKTVLFWILKEFQIISLLFFFQNPEPSLLFLIKIQNLQWKQLHFSKIQGIFYFDNKIKFGIPDLD